MATEVKVKFYKTTVLPVSPFPDSFYFIEKSDRFVIYLTTSAGIALPVDSSKLASIILANHVTDVVSFDGANATQDDVVSTVSTIIKLLST